MSVTVEPFTGDSADWDRLVAAARGGTHFHRIGWLRVIEAVHGHECLALAARAEGGTLAGVLPLVYVRSLLFGRYLVSMPFLNYGGPLGTDEAVRALGARAAELARERGVKLLELRSLVELPLDMPVSHRKITVVLDLPPGDPDRLLASFKGKLRSQVRRPEKEGITVRFGSDQVAPFYDVFSRHMRDLGTPVQPRALFDAMAAEFGDSVWFACAWHGAVPVACGCGFRWGSEFEMTWASSLAAYNAFSPNMGLYWAFMERATREGLATFNFGRCTPGSGTHRFKQQWGGRDVPLYWYQTGATTGTPSPDDARYAWGPRLWKKLPLGLANRVGPSLVRGIP